MNRFLSSLADRALAIGRAHPRRRPPVARLGVLALENRDVPAVFAAFSGGTLTVTITDGNVGPAGAILLNNNNSSSSHSAYVDVRSNSSYANVTVNGQSLRINAGNLLRQPDVQRIVVNGSNSADQISVAAIDTYRGWNNLNDRITLNGYGGDDRIKGSGYRDTINGGSGNDKIDGGEGYDTIDGGTGTDEVYFYRSADNLRNVDRTFSFHL